MKIKKNKEPGTIETKRSDWADLEIPLGKRTRKYRMLEILPGALSYTIILLLFVPDCGVLLSSFDYCNDFSEGGWCSLSYCSRV